MMLFALHTYIILPLTIPLLVHVRSNVTAFGGACSSFVRTALRRGDESSGRHYRVTHHSEDVRTPAFCRLT